jgi:DNA polymerase-3 subunit epsilon
MNFKRIILDSIGHGRLKKLSAFFDAKPEDLRSKISIRQAINEVPNLTEKKLIGRLKVDELKVLCSLCDIPAKGRRAELIRVLLKKHEKSSKRKSRNLRNERQENGADHFVAIDFETADHPRDSACAVALVTVYSGAIVDRSSFLIKPPRKSFSFTHVHGISWSDVANAPTFEEIWPKILPKIEKADFLVAHNAPFDRSVLVACCNVYGLTVPAKRFESTVTWARQVWDLRPTTLPDVCKFLGIPLSHHDPLSDAEACAKIMIRIREETTSVR